MDFKDIYAVISREYSEAKKKHPGWPQHAAAQAGIVVEEAGELMQACLQYKYQRAELSDEEHKARMRKEAIQTAVTAIRFLENLEP